MALLLYQRRLYKISKIGLNKIVTLQYNEMELRKYLA
jgi:hypothetical protein